MHSYIQLLKEEGRNDDGQPAGIFSMCVGLVGSLCKTLSYQATLSLSRYGQMVLGVFFNHDCDDNVIYSSLSDCL